MEQVSKFVFLMLAFVWCGSSALAAPTASNVSFAQRTDGTKLVDLYYDLQGSVSRVVLEVSYDNGLTFSAVSTVSGDVGPSVSAGTRKHMLWNHSHPTA